MTKPLYFRCACESPEHHLTIETFPFDGVFDPVASVYVKLNPEFTFLRRIVVAFKYLFNIQRHEYADVLLSPEQLRELQNFISITLTEIPHETNCNS